MKALSIRQPWATLITNYGKDIENRNWPFPEQLKGQIVAIHASKEPLRYERYSAAETVAAYNLLTLAPEQSLTGLLASFPRGAIIGTARLVDCVSDSPSPWFCGPYGFVLEDARALARPIPCAGRLGFWNVPADITAEIAAEMEKDACG